MTDSQLEFTIGAPVYAHDGRYGTLDKLVVDPHVYKVTHIVVRAGGILSKDRVIPVEKIERADAEGVYVDGTSTELNELPLYEKGAFVQPPESWEPLSLYPRSDMLFWGAPYIGVVPPVVPVVEHPVTVGVPDGEVVVQRGTGVYLGSEPVGRLDHLLIEPSNGTMTHLVVEDKNHRYIVVPAEWIESVDTKAIMLNRWEPERLGMPHYIAAEKTRRSR